MKTALIIIALYLIAAGTIWMGFEQHRANGGIFVPFPSPQTYHLEPTPTPKNF